MEYTEKIKKMLCKELEEYSTKNKLTLPEIDIIQTITDTIKNIDKIEMLEDNDYPEYSGRHYGRMSYDDGSSYGRDRYAKRDSLGRYSRDGEYPEHVMYSRDNTKDHMMSKIGEMMEDADPKEREILKEAMRKIEHA